jgi:hypothetical protein
VPSRPTNPFAHSDRQGRRRGWVCSGKCYFGKGANVDFAPAGKGVRAVFMIMAR